MRTLSLSTAALVLAAVAHAETFVLEDQFDVDDNNYATAPKVLSSATHPNFTPIDDSFDGLLIASFTIEAKTTLPTLNGRGATTFHLYNDSGATEVLGIGNGWWSASWSVWKGPYEGSPFDFLNADGVRIPIFDEVNEVAAGKATMRLTIDYNAFALDTASIQIDGGTNELLPADYSFEEILTKSYAVPSDFTNMSVEIISDDEMTQWEGYDIFDGFYCDTGKFLGLVWVQYAPWVYSFNLDTWICVPEDIGIYEMGRWVYFAR